MWRLFSTLVTLHLVQGKDVNRVIDERTYLLEKEKNMMLGSDIPFSDSEIKVSDILMKLKLEDLGDGSAESCSFTFNASQHFFDYKDEVKKSPLYQLLKKMPKGAILHAHDTGILSPDYVVKLTYLPHLYVCFEQDDIKLLFSRDVPRSDCENQWSSMQEARILSGNTPMFDERLRKHFTLVTENHKHIYTDVNSVWKRFQQYFITTSPLFSYKPVWEQYFYDTLKALRDDNVMYLEIRSVLPNLYDLDGNIYDSVESAKAYKRVLDQFMADYPDFFGAKLIYAPLRKVCKNTVKEYIEIARQIQKELPQFFAGFDIVGQEDLGAPTKDFLDVFSEAADDLDFFFHAGETTHYGTSSDENLVDAIVLGAKRIGHAFALIKHPLLMNEVMQRDIAIEANVISNVVLKLVDDVRNHPLATYLAQSMPVVISSDDPGVWEAEPLTHDFYVIFVGVASKHADLKLLKRLALNSLYYSSHNNKDKLVHEFEIRWTKFIDGVVKNQW